MRFSKNQSCKRRCARCRPRNRLEIGVPTFVSYRAGRCLTRLEVRLESSNVAVREVSGTSLCARFLARSMGRCSVRGAIDGSLLRAWRDRWVVANVAVRGLCLAPCVARWLFPIAETSLCAVFAAISAQNSSEPRCGRSLRPIVFSTLVSYRAGRCLRT